MNKTRTHATQMHEQKLMNVADEKIQTQLSPKHNGATNVAVEQVWNKFSAQLGQFIRARVAHPATAEDILHDVFLKFQSRLDEFRNPAKIRGWLFLVARNAIIDHYRTRKPTSELSESLPVERAATEGIEIEELHVMLRRIIDRLPGPYHEAFVLTAFEGLSQKDVAKRLGISLSGAKSRVQRAREQLKEMLLDFCQREFGRTVGCQPCPRGLFPIVRATKPVTKRKPVPRPKRG
jgi:RNA polymerase sigma-70 factor, ECF subfamily